MKDIIYSLNQEFESRIRLGIMSILMVNDRAEFKTLKDLLDTTDGNLASHLKGLEKSGYIQVKKQFIDRRPNTTYSVSKTGKKEFADHLSNLEKYLKKQK